MIEAAHMFFLYYLGNGCLCYTHSTVQYQLVTRKVLSGDMWPAASKLDKSMHLGKARLWFGLVLIYALAPIYKVFSESIGVCQVLNHCFPSDSSPEEVLNFYWHNDF